MNNKLILLVGGALVVVLGAGVVLMSTNSSTPENRSQDTKTESEDMSHSSNSVQEDAQTTAGNVKKFNVTGKNFTFSPTTLTVNQGDTVQIVFDSSNGTHDFVIDEFNVNSKMVASGGSDTVEFIADKSGTFEYYCSVGNHKQMGMKGTLTVK